MLCAVATAAGCTDDGGNKTFPDTVLDEIPAPISNQGDVRITFRALGNANGFICRLDGGDPSMCISPFEAEIRDGDHTFEVAAALNQNVDETPATHSWRSDTVTPETTLISGPPSLDNATHPEFTFAGSDAGLPGQDAGPPGSKTSGLRAAIAFECALDGGTFGACTSPHSVNVLDGLHMFAVRAKDAAGNVDATPASHGWTVDTAAPDTAITSGPAAGATTAATGAFEFESPDATATFECRIDGAAFAACVSPRSFTLASGSHSFEVRARDATNIDPSPATRTWTVDATPPSATITATPANPSNDGTPQFGFSSTDPTATFQCQIDGVVAFTACSSSWDGPAVADGSRTFRVRAVDGVGNQTPIPPSFSWVVDTVAPTVAITSAPAALSNDPTPTVGFTTAGAPTAIACQIDAGAFAACSSPFTSAALGDGAHSITVRATDAAGNPGTATAMFAIDTAAPTVTITVAPPALTNDPTPTIEFTTAGAPVSVQCRVDAGAFAACSSPFTSAALGDGGHSITVRATDAATNAGTAAASFTVDATPPTVTITAQPPALTNDPTPSVTFTTAGAPAAIACQVDGAAFVACTSPFTSAALPDGGHAIVVRATDGAGNTGSDSAAFTIDATPPTVTITGEPAALSNDNTPTVTFTTGGAPTSTQCRIDAGAFAACTSPFTTAAIGDGSHTISVRVTDAATNSATATTGAFAIDTAAPTVAITGQPAALSNDPTPTVTFTTGGAPTTTQCRVDAGALAACTSPFTTTVGDGSHTITVQVADGAGNASSATTAAFTVDTAAPTVAITSQPAALSNDNTPSVAFTTAGAPTIIQCRVDAAAFVSCTSPFTTTVAEGSHTITIRVADGAGNASSATTAAFTVDTSAPTVAITGQPAALSNDSTPTTTFTTAGAPTVIQCRVDAGAFAACTSPFTAAVADGTHTMSIRVADGATNSTTATTSAFVVDTAAPVVTLIDTPPATWPVDYFDFTFTTSGATIVECDLNGAGFAACTSPHSITTAYNIASSFTVRARDGAGNTTTRQATWTSTPGLVLHYPWEQGSTANTSLLAQVPSHSPDGPGPLPAANVVGGWAGTAIADVAAHKYTRTARPLSSSPNDSYTAAFWIRATDKAQSTSLLSTLDAALSDGFRIVASSSQLRLEVADQGKLFPGTTSIAVNQWVHVAVRTTGIGKGLELFIDGQSRLAVVPPTSTGFGTKQAPDMTIGPFAQLDLDDLRMFNTAFTNQEMCTILARGTISAASGLCAPLRPGLELDFENKLIADTGFWRLPLTIPQVAPTFVATKTGAGMLLPEIFGWGFTSGLKNQVGPLPGRSFAFWFDASAAAGGLLWNTAQQCVVGGPPDLCGIRIVRNAGKLDITTGTALGNSSTITIPVAAGMNSIVVAERRSGSITVDVRIFLNGGAPTVLTFNQGDIYATGTDSVQLVAPGNQLVDEYEFWPTDLASDPELLCENGFDGEVDHATGNCVLTSN